MKYVMEFLKGIFIGGVVMTATVIVLFIAANLVLADDAVAVRDATLGETNRSLNYTVDDATRDRVEHLEVEVTVIVSNLENVPTCAQSNARLSFVLNRIKKYKERTPEYAHIYQKVLDELKDSWCHDDD